MRLKTLKRFLLPTIAIALLAFADQAAKAVSRGAVAGSQCMDVLPGIFQVVQTMNTGSAFGLFRGSSAIIAALSVPVAALLFVAYRKLRNGLQRLGVVLIAAGLVGNTIDRLAWGAVVDFIYLPFLPVWPAFNLADVFLTVGALLVFVPLLSEALAGKDKVGMRSKKLHRKKRSP